MNTNTTRWLAALAIGGASGVGMATTAHAETMKACSLKFQAAKQEGTLNGADWKSFRAAQCGGETASPQAATAMPAAARRAAPAAAGNATFPDAIDKKYASDKPGIGRRKTCLDQYTANKANGSNRGLKWIQKGGGYYSSCVKHLKAG